MTTFCELLKEKRMSQRVIAQELDISLQVIRNWMTKKSLPNLQQIKALSILLQEQEELLFEVFKPDTHTEKAIKDEKEIAWLLREMFHCMKSPHDLIEFSFFFTVRPSKGAIFTRDDRIFFFTKIRWRKGSNAISLSDESDNIVVLTEHNMIDVRSVTVSYDVFMFIVTVNCPVFPSRNGKFLPDEFKQEICILYRMEGLRI